jgi:hypothetical protein
MRYHHLNRLGTPMAYRLCAGLSGFDTNRIAYQWYGQRVAIRQRLQIPCISWIQAYERLSDIFSFEDAIIIFYKNLAPVARMVGKLCLMYCSVDGVCEQAINCN